MSTYRLLSTLIMVISICQPCFSQGWTQVRSGTVELLLELDFTNDSTGWVVGMRDNQMNSSVILHTTDYGQQWFEQTAANAPYLEDVMFVNDSIGWAVGGEGALRKTTNCGTTWTSQSIGGGCNLHEVYFRDLLNGWTVGDVDGAGRLYATTNGGVNWNLQWSGNGSQLLEDITFVDQHQGWAVGWNGTLLHTSNSGNTWIQQNCGTNTDLWDASFTDTLNGWAVGIGRILHTTNGGESWTSQQLSPSIHLFSVTFLNEQEGWICGEPGVMHTTNGGANWIVTFSPPNIVLSSIHFRNSNLGYLIGYDGVIYRYSEPDNSITESNHTIVNNWSCTCYPNPFNTTSTISFQLTSSREVDATLYDIQGRKIQSLLSNNQLLPGTHRFTLYGKDLSSGTYLIQMRVGEYVQSQRIVLLK